MKPPLASTPTIKTLQSVGTFIVRVALDCLTMDEGTCILSSVQSIIQTLLGHLSLKSLGILEINVSMWPDFQIPKVYKYNSTML